MIGDKVVDALEGSLDPELRDLWSWTDVTFPTSDSNDLFDGDGSRSGARNLDLAEEQLRT